MNEYEEKDIKSIWEHLTELHLNEFIKRIECTEEQVYHLILNMDKEVSFNTFLKITEFCKRYDELYDEDINVKILMLLRM